MTETSRLFRGLYFEEFEVGAHYRHALTRTVTEMDNGQRVVNSLFTVALIGAFHVPELTMGTTLGNLGYDSIKFPHPVFHGDTLRGETTILKKRESASRTDSGIVWFHHVGINQRDEVVVDMVRVGLMARQPTTEPETPSPQGDQDS